MKLTPVLCDSRLDDHKLAEMKLALWLNIADKLGSNAGRQPIPFYLCNKNYYYCLAWTQ